MSTEEKLDLILSRLDAIEQQFAVLVQAYAVKDFYTTAEVAVLVNREEFTVREWCRLGRLKGEKKNSGRGRFHEWVISREELSRYQREGLRPLFTNHHSDN